MGFQMIFSNSKCVNEGRSAKPHNMNFNGYSHLLIFYFFLFIIYGWYLQANDNTEITFITLIEIDWVMHIYLIDIINRKNNTKHKNNTSLHEVHFQRLQIF